MTSTSSRQQSSIAFAPPRTPTRMPTPIYRATIRIAARSIPNPPPPMTERLHEYGAEVVECPPPSPRRHNASTSIQRPQHFRRASGLPPDWLDPNINWKLDNIFQRRNRALRRRPHRLFRRCRGLRHHRPPPLPHRRAPRHHSLAGFPPLHSPRFAHRRDFARILRPLPNPRGWPPISPAPAPPPTSK